MGIITRINWVDVFILILLLRMGYVAFRDGLSREIFPLIGSVVLIVVSLQSYKSLGSWLSQKFFSMPLDMANLLAFLLLSAGIGLLFKLVKAVLDRIIKVEWHPIIERFGGIIAGVVRSFITAGIVLTIIVLMPLPYLRWSVCERSLTGKYFLGIGPAIYQKALPFLEFAGIKPSGTKEGLIKDLMSVKPAATKIPKKAKNSSREE